MISISASGDTRARRRSARASLRLVPDTPLADGTRDVSLGVGGQVEIGGPPIGAAWALAIDGQGRILFSADSEVGPALVARLLPDGVPDPTWGEDGIVMTLVEGRSQLYALLVDADDRVTGVGLREHVPVVAHRDQGQNSIFENGAADEAQDI